MTDKKKTYWVHDADTYALVTGAEERDRYVGAGWVETDEPTEGFVHVWHANNEQPGRTTVEALREVHAPTGWITGPPPGGVNPFKDAAADESKTPAPADSKTGTKSSKPAASGDEKE